MIWYKVKMRGNGEDGYRLGDFVDFGDIEDSTGFWCTSPWGHAIKNGECLFCGWRGRLRP